MSLWEKIKASGLLAFQTAGRALSHSYGVTNGIDPVKAYEVTKTTVTTTKKAGKNIQNFTGWINDNWQIAIIGLVAIIILLKD